MLIKISTLSHRKFGNVTTHRRAYGGAHIRFAWMQRGQRREFRKNLFVPYFKQFAIDWEFRQVFSGKIPREVIAVSVADPRCSRRIAGAAAVRL